MNVIRSNGASGLFFGLLIGLLIVCYQLYSPGLSGEFFFDDEPNLSVLGELGVVDSLEKLGVYLNSGFAGPTKRPVAMATFLLDAQTWPADPLSFKRTNVLIHLLNGCLLLWFIYLLIGIVRPIEQSKAALVALSCAAIWLLHPLWVSSVLYVIQRMAMLAATFSLVTLIIFLKFRIFVLSGRASLPIFVAYGSGCLAFSVLAIFSKENAVLIPVLLLALELVLHAKHKIRVPSWRLVQGLILIGSLLVAGYLISKGVALWSNDATRRDFTGSQRFWTEGRVLWMYLYDIVIPKVATSGLFPEIAPSLDAFRPVSGLLGWMAILALIVFAVMRRRELPYLCLGILGFFGGHLIESTVIPLELYFEHRNYLPAALLAVALLELTTRIKKAYLQMALYLSVMMVLAGMLYMRADTWSSYSAMVKSWAMQDPNSVRSQLEASRISFLEGNLEGAAGFLAGALERHPDAVEPLLLKMLLDCSLARRVVPDEFTRAKRLLEKAKDSGTIFRYLSSYVETEELYECGSLDIVSLVSAYQDSPFLKNRKTSYRLDMLVAQYHVNTGRVDRAIERYGRAVRGLKSINSGLLAVSYMASKGYHAEAEKVLDEYEHLYQDGKLRGSDLNYADEIRRLKENIHTGALRAQGLLPKKSP